VANQKDDPNRLRLGSWFFRYTFAQFFLAFRGWRGFCCEKRRRNTLRHRFSDSGPTKSMSSNRSQTAPVLREKILVHKAHECHQTAVSPTKGMTKDSL
jgi:hypothetical protein